MGTKKYPKVRLRTSSSFDFDLTILLKLTRNTAKPSHKPSFPLVNLHIHKYTKTSPPFIGAALWLQKQLNADLVEQAHSLEDRNQIPTVWSQIALRPRTAPFAAELSVSALLPHWDTQSWEKAIKTLLPTHCGKSPFSCCHGYKI